ncbi:hypothetical protein H5410_046316 [Solanum commersonii]|uniref:Uncharacterized protein n=1 Tax=Solanum commersonii TaxID=4109 RepID=A0A9J5XDV3_SOLCO|nr:hypothetical protein H5410_046316 [Solanum commersonii]
MVIRKDMSRPMNVKIQRSKGLTRRTFARKICLHAFSTKWKGQTSVRQAVGNTNGSNLISFEPKAKKGSTKKMVVRRVKDLVGDLPNRGSVKLGGLKPYSAHRRMGRQCKLWSPIGARTKEF